MGNTEPSDDTADTWRRALVTWVRQHTPTVGIQQHCPHCHGSGEITTERERRLDELSTKQIRFLQQAYIERENAKWGGGDSDEGSGGQQQRLAIARAQISEPDIILSDEPTGNLDSVTGNEIMALFQKINQEKNKTIVQVTHSEDAAKYGTRIIRLKDGRLV